MIDLKPTALIIAMAACLTLSLLNFFTIAAVLPELIAAWSLNKTQAGWLVSVYFAGYMACILFVASLTDRIDPRRIYLVGAFLGGLSSLALALFADGFWFTMMLRFLGGVAFTGMYMPGLRALTEQLPPPLRNRGVVYYTSCFALGSGFSIFAAGRIAALYDWRWAFFAAAFASFLAMIIAAIVLRPNKPVPAAQKITHLGAYKRVWKNRKAMAYILTMFGVGWEVFAFRGWIVTYLAGRQGAGKSEIYLFSPPDVAFLTAAVGIPVSMWLGEWAARMNRERLLLIAAGLSLAVAAALALSASWHYNISLTLCFLFSMTSFGRSAATTAGMMTAAEDSVRGATMAAYSFTAFLAGIVSPLVLGFVLDMSGLILGYTSWTVGFLSLAIGSAISLTGLLLARRASTGHTRAY